MKLTEAEMKEWSRKGFFGLTTVCDNPECGKPITFLTYKGKDGQEFCSNSCLEKCGAVDIPARKKKPKSAITIKEEITTTPEPEVQPPQQEEKIMAAAATAKKAPKKKTAVKTAVKAAAKTAAKKKTARATKAATNGSDADAHPKIVGKYRAGSAQAVYVQRLADGQPHTLEELSKDFNLHDPRDPLWYIGKYGKEEKLWSIDRDKENGTYTLVPTSKGTKLLATLNP